jgi:hypothetical protein
MRGQPVRRGIHRARAGRGALDILVERADCDHTSCAIAVSLPSGRRRQPDPLDGRGAVGGDAEHLLARQRDLDRALELARRQCRQDRIGIDRQLAAEAAADELAHHLDILRRDLERRGDRMLGAGDQLGGAVDGQPVAVPRRKAGRRLHRVVALVGRGVGRVDLRSAFGEATIEIADPGIGLAGHHRARRIGELAARREVVEACLRLVGDLDQPGCRGRLLEGVGDHQCYRLAMKCTRASAELGLGAAVAVSPPCLNGACAGAFSLLITSTTPAPCCASLMSTLADGAAADRAGDDHAERRMLGAHVAGDSARRR